MEEIRRYGGVTEAERLGAFTADAARAATSGWAPVSTATEPGAWGQPELVARYERRPVPPPPPGMSPATRVMPPAPDPSPSVGTAVTGGGATGRSRPWVKRLLLGGLVGLLAGAAAMGGTDEASPGYALASAIASLGLAAMFAGGAAWAWNHRTWTPAVRYGAVAILALFAVGSVAGAGGRSAAPTGAGSVNTSGTGAATPIRFTRPTSGAVLSEARVEVLGTTAPGSRVVRDIAGAPDDHVTADATGAFSLWVQLEPGGNDLVFRVGDDRTTEAHLLVTLVPAADRTASPPAATRESPAATAASPAPPSPATPDGGLGTAPIGPVERARVVRIVDGDTIVVDRGNGPEKVRYIGVDTPETVKPDTPVEWMGKEASAYNGTLVDGKEVLLEKDVSETDKFDRLLRYVWVADDASPSGWLLVNGALVAAGFAQVSTFPPDVRYVDYYLGLQQAARDQERGLWGPQPTPKPTARPTPKPTRKPQGDTRPRNCDPSYPDVCIKKVSYDLDCKDIPYRYFEVLPPDPHGFDGDGDGIGCESG